MIQTYFVVESEESAARVGNAYAVRAVPFFVRILQAQSTLWSSRHYFPRSCLEVYRKNDPTMARLYSASRQDDTESRKVLGGSVGDRVLGSRLHAGLTISENSAEVFCSRFSSDGRYGRTQDGFCLSGNCSTFGVRSIPWTQVWPMVMRSSTRRSFARLRKMCTHGHLSLVLTTHSPWRSTNRALYVPCTRAYVSCTDQHEGCSLLGAETGPSASSICPPDVSRIIYKADHLRYPLQKTHMYWHGVSVPVCKTTVVCKTTKYGR